MTRFYSFSGVSSVQTEERKNDIWSLRELARHFPQ